MIRGRDNAFDATGAALRDVVLDVVGDDNRVTIGRGSVVTGLRLRLRGSHHRVVIGAGCRFDPGSTIWVEDSGCVLTIGDGTRIVQAEIALTEPGSAIHIGANCMLAHDVDIRCGDSHSIIDLASGRRINPARDIRIADHVWLAAHCRVLKGVTIGRDSVVGSASVVTGPVPPNAVAAGVPARVVRRGVTWTRQRIYDAETDDAGVPAPPPAPGRYRGRGPSPTLHAP